VIINDV